jgi:hypothetical protein
MTESLKQLLDLVQDWLKNCQEDFQDIEYFENEEDDKFSEHIRPRSSQNSKLSR